MRSPALPGFGDLAAVDRLRQFVRGEFDLQRRKHRERIALPLADRLEKGSCLADLAFESFDRGLAVFRHGGNDSRLREGDAVLLRHLSSEDAGRKGGAGETLSGFIYREERDRLWLSVGFEAIQRLLDLFGRTGWLVDEAFLDLESRYLDALEAVERTTIGQDRILPLFEDPDKSATFDLDEEEYMAALGELECSPDRWEEAQEEAIAACLAAEHCYLVQGPPGTGKTRALAETVGRLVRRGERVLVTAFTHRAIDHALGACARAVGDRDRVVRFAPPRHCREETFAFHEEFAQSPLAGLAGGWVAGATPFALRKHLPGVEFDTIVIDEAGQMNAPLAIMAMLAGRKYLFFGDQQQLGPVVLSLPRREAGEIGILHRLPARSTSRTRLNVTYRLNDVLSRWPSENFYQGDLQPAPSVAGQRLAWSPPPGLPDWIAETLAPERPLVCLRGRSSKSRTSNGEEAAAVAEILRALKRGGVTPSSVAVVTPYRRQARLVRRRLETLAPGTNWDECLVDTVERMQGQEREVVVLSMCASQPAFLERQAEFLLDPRRLNVAATRARTKLIVLASHNLLSQDLDDTDLREDFELLFSLCSEALPVDLPPAFASDESHDDTP